MKVEIKGGVLRGEQARFLVEYAETVQGMWDMRLDALHDIVVARAQGFIHGALGLDLSAEEVIEVLKQVRESS